jgi:tRNA dimethylallyltransferase
LTRITVLIVEKKSANTLICVCGPTAVGKTAMAIAIAQHFHCEIISFDSRQFYRELSIGTAVPSADELAAAKHHFIHDRSINNSVNAGSFEKEALAKLEELFSQNPIVVAVGGTGLYLRALLEGMDDLPPIPGEIRQGILADYEREGLSFLQDEVARLDPVYWQKVDQKNPQRLIRALELLRHSGKAMDTLQKAEKKHRPFKAIKIGLNIERPDLYERINKRVDLMFDAGLIEEVKNLQDYRQENALQTVGYNELFSHFDGDLSLEEAQNEIKKNSRRYAKRQLTWFRRGSEVTWFSPLQKEAIIEFLNSSLDA